MENLREPRGELPDVEALLHQMRPNADRLPLDVVRGQAATGDAAFSVGEAPPIVAAATRGQRS